MCFSFHFIFGQGLPCNSDVYISLQNETWVHDLNTMKGTQLGLKGFVTAIFMTQLIMGKLIWRRNPNYTRFLKVPLNLTFILALQFGLYGANFLLLVNQAYFNCSTGSLFKLDITLPFSYPWSLFGCFGYFLQHYLDAVAIVVNKSASRSLLVLEKP